MDFYFYFFKLTFPIHLHPSAVNSSSPLNISLISPSDIVTPSYYTSILQQLYIVSGHRMPGSSVAFFLRAPLKKRPYPSVL